MNFSGKTAVVTGGSRGIGRAVCLELAKGGANVVLCYAGNESAAHDTVTACEALGAKALAVRCNVAESGEVKSLLDAAVQAFGRIDILVNNAGITRDNLMVRMSEADFDAVISVNLKGMFNTIHALYRPMMKKGGRIINIASVSGMMGNVGQANYSAAKAGVIGLTKTVAKELATRNVTVNAIAPGFIATQMTEVLSDAAKETALSGIPMKKMGRPEDIANAAVFLASDMASYITGEVLRVDGGMCM